MKQMKIMATIASTFLIALSSVAVTNTTQSANTENLEGIYRVDVDFGERQFLDLMIIESAPAKGEDGEVTGSFIVPNAFTTPLTGHVKTDLSEKKSTLQFSITIDEGGGTQEFNFQIDLSHCYKKTACDRFTGQLSNNDRVVGQLKAVRLVEAGN